MFVIEFLHILLGTHCRAYDCRSWAPIRNIHGGNIVVRAKGDNETLTTCGHQPSIGNQIQASANHQMMRVVGFCVKNFLGR